MVQIGRKLHPGSLVALFLAVTIFTLFAPASEAGSILREVFQGIGGSTLADLTNSPAYPSRPTLTNLVTDLFESPSNFDDNYGQRMHGYILPPVSGNYTFWIATDDNGALFLSTDDNPVNAKLICSVPGWVAARNWTGYPDQKSASIPLQSGKAYYISALQKEGGGGDNLAVRWLRPDGVDQGPIPATYLLPYGASFTPPIITAQPSDTTAVEGELATFNVQIKNLDLVSYQWFKNGASIPGATGSSYQFGPVTLNDEGTTFSATLTNKLGSTNTAVATLHVVPDTTPPKVTLVINNSATSLLVTFSEPIDPASASVAQNFRLSGGVSVSGASAGADGRSVILTTTPMTFGNTYTLTVNNVKDRARTPNAIIPNSQTSFLALEFVSQGLGGAAGSIQRISSTSFDLAGSGADIGGSADQFEYAWQLRSGDFDLQVRVQDVKITEAYLHAGLMARASLDTNAPFAASFGASARIGSFFESRGSTGAAASIATPVGTFPANYPQGWLRLKRAGNVFTGYGSLDGIAWVQLGTATITMPSQLYVGLALSSQSSTVTSAAQFRDYGAVQSTATGSYKPDHEPLAPSSRATGLIFTEVMYHPSADARFTNDLEYIEIFNADDFPEDLTGYQITGGVSYKFPDGFVLPAGAFVVVALDPNAIQTAYGINNVLGPYSGKLNNAGDTIELRDGNNAVKLSMTYADTAPWPVAADGAGHSLVLVRPSYGEGDARAWAPSALIGGSPGRDEPIVSNPNKDVWINEFLINSDGTQEPFVELYNHDLTAVDLSGCFLTGSADTNKFRIPDGTRIEARGYRSFPASQLGFLLNAAGDSIFLVNAATNRVLDAIAFTGQEAGVSTGRSPDGSDTIRRLSQPTAGAANASWRIEDVVINEIMYAPITGDKNDQYIELYNRSGSTIDLSTWRIGGAVDYKFPAGTKIAPDGYIVVGHDRNQLLANYPQLNLGNTFGNFSGSLSKSGDHITVTKQGFAVATNELSQAVTNKVRITTAEVTYVGGGRWGKFSHEGGSSMELIDPRADLLRASNWADSDETQKAGWTTNTFTGVLDNGVSGYNPDRLYVFTMDGGESLVDEIEVIKAGSTTNALANGDFEAGTTSWSFFGDHSRSTVDVGTGINGSRALHLRGDDKGMQGINSCRTPLAGLAAGNTVTIRAKTRWLAGFPEVMFHTRGNWIEMPVHMSVPKNLGTPGLPNSRLASPLNAGPAVYDVSHFPVLPRAGNPVVVTCKVSDPDGIGSVVLRYRVDPNTALTSVTMRDDGTGGDAVAGDGIYSGIIPAQSAGAMIGFKIVATDAAGANPASATFPAGGMWQVALPSPECYVRWGDTLPSGTFAFYYLWDSQASEGKRNNALNNTYRDATLVYGNWRAIYNAGFRDKGSPYHGGAGSFSVINPEEEPLLGATDRIFRTTGNGSADGIPIRNRVSSWIGRKMNIPYLNSHYMQLYRNGTPHENVSQDEEYPGVGYSKQWFPDGSNGDVYKIAVWFEFQDDNLTFGATSATIESFKSGGQFKLARYRWNWQSRGFFGTYNNYTNIFNLAAAANDTSTNFVQNVLNIADVEEWMRVFAFDRVLGNWDSWTYNVGQNMFAVKQAGLPWAIMPWDIDFTMGAGDGPTGALWGGQDPIMNNWFNVPAFRRMLWRSYQKALEAALDPAQYKPIGDALQAAMVRNIGAVTGPSSLYSFLAQRRSFIQSQLQANDVTQFSITSNSGKPFTSTTPATVLSGKAPFAVVSVAVNGTVYPTVWTDQNSWSINIPLATGTSTLSVTGVDKNGNPIPGYGASVAATYAGAAPLPQDNVVINEIHYNPLESKASFIELYNRSTTTPFDLSGYRLDGVRFAFPAGSVIQPGAFFVVAQDRAKFALAYGQTIPVIGEFPGNLDNAGEAIRLVKPQGAGGTNDLVISDVQYSSSLPWPTNANGLGPSLQLIDSSKGSYSVANWAATAPDDANRVTPGRANSVRGTISPLPTVWLNEVLPDNINGPLDNAGEREPFIELYNSGATSVSLSGLYLSDNYTNLTQWPFPADASIGPKQFLLVWADGQTAQTAAGALHTSFRLNSTNGSVALSRIQNGAVALDYLDYAQITPGRSFGSFPDGDPRNRRVFSNVTPRGPNDAAVPAANVFINEFMASNTATLLDPATGNFEDWFELYNAGPNDVDLTSFTLTSSLTNAAEFRIPPGYLLPAGGFLLVWADKTASANQPGGPLHANFALAKAGGEIGLFDPNGKLVDAITFGLQGDDVSQGRFPDGDTGPLVTFAGPTPGKANVLGGANQPPTLAAIPDQTLPEQTELRFTASASDPDAGQTVQFSLGAGSPAGALIDPATGQFSWTPTEEQGPGNYTLAVIATDNGTPPRSAVQRLNVRVTEVNRKPVLDAIAPLTVEDGLLVALTAVATDPDLPANHLTFSLAPSAPAGAVIDPATGRFSWTPPIGVSGTYPVTVLVVDDGTPALSDQKTFQIAVNAVDHPPVMEQLSTQFVDEGATLRIAVHATDPNTPPASITYALEGVGLPSGLSIDASTGIITWTPTETQGPDTYGVNVRATKNSGAHLSSAMTFAITVNEVNQPPVLASIPDLRVEEGAVVKFSVVGSDPDRPAQTLSYALLPGAPAGATIDSVSGLFRWQIPSDSGAATNTIGVTVTDNGPGTLSATNSFHIVVVPKFHAVINEIMYHPANANAAYVEILNPSTVSTQDLTNVKLGGPRMNYAFPAGTKLTPGQLLVIAQNKTAYLAAYGSATPVFGEWTGSFDRTDGWVQLYSLDNQGRTNVLNRVNFEPVLPWATNADDGAGSLQLIDPTRDNSRVGNWTAAPTNAQPQWQHVVATGTASSSTLYLYLETIGDVYLDDVVLVAGSAPEAGQNFVANGDFESALSGPWTVSPNLAKSALSTTVKHSGKSSLHLVTTAGGTTRASAIYQDLATALTSGAAYTLSYWYLPNTNGGTLTLRLSGSGIKSTLSIAPTSTVVTRVTPGAANSVRTALDEFPPVWINEILPNNASGLTDQSGTRQPWIELINTGADPLDLSGWFLTDDFTAPGKWAFPSQAQIPAGGYLVIFTDGRPASSTGNEFHTSFRLPASSGNIALVRPQATGLAVVDYAKYGAIPADASLAAVPDGQGFHREVTASTTPGGANTLAAPNQPPAIATPPAQTVQAGDLLTLQLSALDPDLPAQMLAFSLDAGPQGATVSPAGVFNWQPGVAQIGSTIVRVRVTDNGVPPLSAPTSFTVAVTPIQAPTITLTAGADPSGAPKVTWNTKIGVSYRLQYTESLTEPDWSLLSQIVATGSSASTVDAGGGKQRFYRVVSP